MRHLVLGSSGQIGGHLIKYLDKQGEQYFEFDTAHDSFEDLRTPQHFLLENYIKNCDIVHFLIIILKILNKLLLKMITILYLESII